MLIGEEDDWFRQKLLPAAAADDFETMTSWTERLERHGFVNAKAKDVSPDYASSYQEAEKRLLDSKNWVTENYGSRVFDNAVEIHGVLTEALRRRQWGVGQFFARQPE